jgi:hypothetical protein
MLAHIFSPEKLTSNGSFIPLFDIVSWKNRSVAQTPSSIIELRPFFENLNTGKANRLQTA